MNLVLELTKENFSCGSISCKLCNLSKIHFLIKLPCKIVELTQLLVLSEMIQV